jgi:hypothetical protein
MSWEEGFLNITWEYYRELAFELAEKLAGRDFDLIVAIARGGLTLSQLLSDCLSLPIASFTVKSYKDLTQTSEPVITHGLGATLEGKKVLLVDDVSDTGKTFLRGIKYLEELGAQKRNITTVSLHYKPHSVYKPDFFVSTTDKWVIYPYELHETMAVLGPKWQKEGISKSEIRSRFAQFKFPQGQVKKYLNTH